MALLLGTNESHVKWLAKRGYLTFIWGSNQKKMDNARYLDPTPEYKEKLQRGEVFYDRMNPPPNHIDNVPLLSREEVAMILGSKKLVTEGTPERYTVEQVRNMLWKRGNRTASKDRSPFLIMELIRFFWRRNGAAAKVIPTDAEYAQDEIVFEKLRRMMQMPPEERQQALIEFFGQIEVAKTVVEVLPTPP